MNLSGDIQVRLCADGLGMGEVADAPIYSGRSPDKTIEPDPYYTFQADRAFVLEHERRRGLMPNLRSSLLGWRMQAFAERSDLR